MSSNKKAKNALIRRYGAVDFLDALHIAVPTSKTYTSKGQMRRMKQLTYHHIKEKSKGGTSTIENGALLTAEHHCFFHQQPPQVQRRLNSVFQEYKKRKDEELPLLFVEPDEIPLDLSVVEMDITEKNKVRFYNRMRVKEETRREIEEELSEYLKDFDDEYYAR